MKGLIELTKRQLQVLPYLLACGTYEEAARQANISVKQIYCWLRTSVFREELDRREFGHKKAEHLVISDKTFSNVPMTGQLSNHFIEGMRKIYELEPFIKMESSLADERGKGSKIYKRAV